MFWLRFLVGWKQFPGELRVCPGSPSAPWTIPVQQEARLCFCSGHSEKQEIGSDLVPWSPGWLESPFSQSRPKRGSLISQSVRHDLLPGIQALLKHSQAISAGSVAQLSPVHWAETRTWIIVLIIFSRRVWCRFAASAINNTNKRSLYSLCYSAFRKM